MQWDDTTHAGVARQGARPWRPLAPDYRARNVAAQENDPASMLTLFRQLTALRRAEPALNRGAIELIDVGVKDVLAYRRTAGSDGFVVVLNLGGKSQALDLAAVGAAAAEVVLSTDPDRQAGALTEAFSLAAHEGVILRLAG